MKNNLTILASEWYEFLADTVKDKIITPILVLLAAAGVIYAIVVGIRFVKADEKTQREEAKAKLLSVLIGIGVTIVLIALFIWLSMQFRKEDSSLNKWKDNILPTGWCVVYDENGGNSVSDASGLKIGDTITLEIPTKDGSTFAGWKKEDGTILSNNNGAETKYTIAEADDVDKDEKIELVAQWNDQ